MGGYLKKGASRLRYELGYKAWQIGVSHPKQASYFPDLQSKNVVFSLNSGRSGSETLQKLFECVDSVHSEHEPKPGFHEVMRLVQTRQDMATYFVQSCRFPVIARVNKPNYVETSHLVCKGFFETIMASAVNPAFIVLKRDARLVAKSILRLGAVPQRTRLGIQFYLSPSPSSFLQIRSDQELTDYQLCYWYALEIEQRQAVYSEVLSRMNGRQVSIKTQDMNSFEAVLEMFAQLGIEPTDKDLTRLRERVGGVYNHRPEAKKLETQTDFQSEEIALEKMLVPNIQCDDVLSNIRRLSTMWS
ncbi:hypothetical protein [Thalassospira sp.]|uniref:hypothetical protein n=1 Tax=Thalassospira sp. TaxID=1912094 RepID=UPI003AA840BE